MSILYTDEKEVVMAKIRRAQTKTKHHMVPRSRCANDASGESRINLKKVPHKKHDCWHRLFANLTPIEVLDAILKHFVPEDFRVSLFVKAQWEEVEYTTKYDGKSFGEKQFLYLSRRDDYAWNVVFGKDCTAFSAMIDVIESWAPLGYFTYVWIQVEGNDHIEAYHMKS